MNSKGNSDADIRFNNVAERGRFIRSLWSQSYVLLYPVTICYYDFIQLHTRPRFMCPLQTFITGAAQICLTNLSCHIPQNPDQQSSTSKRKHQIICCLMTIVFILSGGFRGTTFRKRAYLFSFLSFEFSFNTFHIKPPSTAHVSGHSRIPVLPSKSY